MSSGEAKEVIQITGSEELDTTDEGERWMTLTRPQIEIGQKGVGLLKMP